MSRIKSFVGALVGLRKLFFSIGAITFIAVSFLIVLGVFITNWYLGTSVISGDNFKDITVAGYQYIAAIVAAYLAVNVANKWVEKWLKRK